MKTLLLLGNYDAGQYSIHFWHLHQVVNYISFIFLWMCNLMLLTGYLVPIIFFHTDFSVYPGPVAGHWDFFAVAAYSFSSKLFYKIHNRSEVSDQCVREMHVSKFKIIFKCIFLGLPSFFSIVFCHCASSRKNNIYYVPVNSKLKHLHPDNPPGI